MLTGLIFFIFTRHDAQRSIDAIYRSVFHTKLQVMACDDGNFPSLGWAVPGCAAAKSIPALKRGRLLGGFRAGA
jgi:hypothetical protein